MLRFIVNNHRASRVKFKNFSTVNRLCQQQNFVPKSTPIKPIQLGQIKPNNNYYFTGRPLYESSLSNLRSLLLKSQRKISLSLALPTNKLNSLKNSNNDNKKIYRWLSQVDIENKLQTNLKASEYKSLVSLLNSITNLLPAAKLGGSQTANVVDDIELTIRNFEPPGGREISLSERKPVQIDSYGRSYTLGRRKNSSARVWLIPIPKIEDSFKPSEILVNNKPLVSFFSRVHDRELITLPLRLTGQLTNFNIFTLVRGGGTSGQAGAVAHGIAKGLLGQIDQRLGLEPDDDRSVKRILKKGTYFCIKIKL